MPKIPPCWRLEVRSVLRGDGWALRVPAADGEARAELLRADSL